MVLIALGYKWDEIHFQPQQPYEVDIYYTDQDFIDWDLTKDLDNQSSDTIDSLLKLIKGEVET